MDRCPLCGSHDITVIPGPHPGGHHAKLKCHACKHWRWLAAPRGETSAELFRLAAARSPGLDAPLPPLVGTERQVAFAATCRAAMLRRLAAPLSADAFRALRGITAASWWIANKDRKAEDLRWPAEWFDLSASAVQGSEAPCPP